MRINIIYNKLCIRCYISLTSLSCMFSPNVTSALLNVFIIEFINFDFLDEILDPALDGFTLDDVVGLVGF